MIEIKTQKQNILRLLVLNQGLAPLLLLVLVLDQQNTGSTDSLTCAYPVAGAETTGATRYAYATICAVSAGSESRTRR